jgi:BMFP domain-containing protein YqiC
VSELQGASDEKVSTQSDISTELVALRQQNSKLTLELGQLRAINAALVAAPSVGIAVAASSSVQPVRPTPVDAVSCIPLPSNEDLFLRSFLQQMISSDDLLRQMVAPKRAAAQLLNLYAQIDGAAREQFELFQKAFAVNTAEAALDVVRRSYGEATDSMLVHAAGKLAELQRDFPELAERAKSNDAAEDALCLTHLHAVCKRAGVSVHTR